MSPTARGQRRLQMPPKPRFPASYSRFSSDNQDKSSVTDQQRYCQDRALVDGLTINPDQEYADHAVSGTLLRRDGLDRLLSAARAGTISVVYFYSLSRLAREEVISLPILKELVYVCKTRISSVTEPGIDSTLQGWELNATFTSLFNRQQIDELSKLVFRGQEGAILANYSVGDHCFGLKSVPSPNGEKIGRGRQARPRMVYVIDPVEANWVRQIFHWYVQEQRRISWIVRELNRLKAPKDHRAKTPLWQHPNVITVLRNRKYVEDWPWGELKNCRNPLTGKISQEERPAGETEKWLRHRPDLRIVDDETYYKAQQRLDAE